MNVNPKSTGFSTIYFLKDVHKIDLDPNQVVVRNHKNPCDLVNQELRDLFYQSCYIFDRESAEQLVQQGYQIIEL